MSAAKNDDKQAIASLALRCSGAGITETRSGKLLGARYLKARKVHFCERCSLVIAPQEEYVHYVKDGGNGRLCVSCYEA